MAAKVFGWLGTSRRRLALSRLILAAQSWWDAWAIEAATVQGLEAEDADVQSSCFLLEATGRYALRLDADLAAALTGIVEIDGGELSAHVSRVALADLAQRLGETSVAKPPVLTEVPGVPDELAESRWGGCCFLLTFGAMRMWLWLDRQAIDHWVPRAPAPPATLVNRVEAAAPVTARLSASLDLGEISLEELTGLVPGDVIATSAPLTRSVDVVMAHGQQRVFHGQLGERGGRRALRLLSPEIPESNP